MITSKTPLYKAVKKALGKDADWKQISRELVSVRQDLPLHVLRNFNREHLGEAFLWDSTQQGFMYWHRIASRMSAVVLANR